MGNLLAKKEEPLPEPITVGVEESLRQYYNRKVLPVELRHDYAHFHSPYLDDAEFAATPSVLFVGQYSVGKTSMISYLLNSDFPGASIGPEPTTDGFVVVTQGKDPQILLGASLVKEANFPFKSLEKFGPTFLAKLSGSHCPADILQHLTFVDTPGILSGEKQRVSRGYDFSAVIRYFAEKVDRILLLFDTSKLDISDEFKLVLQSLQGNEEKVKIILNKADSVEPRELIRVRGALMWNLGKILNAPEVPRVVIGSFWDEPVKREALVSAFHDDYVSLLTDLQNLTKTVKVRKINDIAKRARQARSHALLMNWLLKNRCVILGKRRGIARKCRPLSLMKAYTQLKKFYPSLTDADLPDPKKFQEKFEAGHIGRWKTLKKKQMKLLDEFIDRDVSNIIGALPPHEQVAVAHIEALQRNMGAENMIPRVKSEEACRTGMCAEEIGLVNANAGPEIGFTVPKKADGKSPPGFAEGESSGGHSKETSKKTTTMSSETATKSKQTTDKSTHEQPAPPPAEQEQHNEEQQKEEEQKKEEENDAAGDSKESEVDQANDLLFSGMEELVERMTADKDGKEKKKKKKRRNRGSEKN